MQYNFIKFTTWIYFFFCSSCCCYYRNKILKIKPTVFLCLHSGGWTGEKSNYCNRNISDCLWQEHDHALQNLSFVLSTCFFLPMVVLITFELNRIQDEFFLKKIHPFTLVVNKIDIKVGIGMLKSHIWAQLNIIVYSIIYMVFLSLV